MVSLFVLRIADAAVETQVSVAFLLINRQYCCVLQYWGEHGFAGAHVTPTGDYDGRIVCDGLASLWQTDGRHRGVHEQGSGLSAQQGYIKVHVPGIVRGMLVDSAHRHNAAAARASNAAQAQSELLWLILMSIDAVGSGDCPATVQNGSTADVHGQAAQRHLEGKLAFASLSPVDYTSIWTTFGSGSIAATEPKEGNYKSNEQNVLHDAVDSSKLNDSCFLIIVGVLLGRKFDIRAAVDVFLYQFSCLSILVFYFSRIQSVTVINSC